MKNSLIAILLNIAFITPSAVTTWVHFVQKEKVKEEVKRTLAKEVDESELVTFIFNDTELETKLRWEHSHEFEYKGQMYDVITREKRDGLSVFVCWHDKKETKLNKRLQVLTQMAFEKDAASNKNKKSYIVFSRMLFFEPISYWDPIPHTVCINKIFYLKHLRDSKCNSQIFHPPISSTI